MRSVSRIRLSPALVVAVAALLVAVGGSAVAVGHSASSVVQARCATGSVRGIAYVTGDPHKGIANLPGEYSSASNLFGYRWNCSGGAIQVRLSSCVPGFDVRFAGNPAQFAVGNVIADAGNAISVKRNDDGSFHVAVSGVVSTNGAFQGRQDVPFVIVLF